VADSGFNGLTVVLAWRKDTTPEMEKNKPTTKKTPTVKYVTAIPGAPVLRVDVIL